MSAVALSEKVPDPAAAPALVHAARGRAARPRRVRGGARERGLRARRPGGGARAVRDARRPARRLPGDRGARGARRHVRRRDRIAALVLDVHPALAGGRRGGRDRARGRARARASRAGRDRGRQMPTDPFSCRRRRGRATRRASVRTSPSCCRSSASARCSTWSATDTELVVAAEEELEPVLGDHWSDVCAAFGDEDAHHLYVSPQSMHDDARRARAHLAVGAVERTGDRAARAVRGHRRALARGGRAASSRSSCAPATARSSRSRAAARASAPPTTSGA